MVIFIYSGIMFMHYINIFLLHIYGKNNVLILQLCIQFYILTWLFGNGLWAVVTTSSPETVWEALS